MSLTDCDTIGTPGVSGCDTPPTPCRHLRWSAHRTGVETCPVCRASKLFYCRCQRCQRVTTVFKLFEEFEPLPHHSPPQLRIDGVNDLALRLPNPMAGARSQSASTSTLAAALICSADRNPGNRTSRSSRRTCTSCGRSLMIHWASVAALRSILGRAGVAEHPFGHRHEVFADQRRGGGEGLFGDAVRAAGTCRPCRSTTAIRARATAAAPRRAPCHRPTATARRIDRGAIPFQSRIHPSTAVRRAVSGMKIGLGGLPGARSSSRSRSSASIAHADARRFLSTTERDGVGPQP